MKSGSLVSRILDTCLGAERRDAGLGSHDSTPRVTAASIPDDIWTQAVPLTANSLSGLAMTCRRFRALTQVEAGPLKQPGQVGRPESEAGSCPPSGSVARERAWCNSLRHADSFQDFDRALRNLGTGRLKAPEYCAGSLLAFMLRPVDSCHQVAAVWCLIGMVDRAPQCADLVNRALARAAREAPVMEVQNRALAHLANFNEYGRLQRNPSSEVSAFICEAMSSVDLKVGQAALASILAAQEGLPNNLELCRALVDVARVAKHDGIRLGAAQFLKRSDRVMSELVPEYHALALVESYPGGIMPWIGEVSDLEEERRLMNINDCGLRSLQCLLGRASDLDARVMSALEDVETKRFTDAIGTASERIMWYYKKSSR